MDESTANEMNKDGGTPLAGPVKDDPNAAILTADALPGDNAGAILTATPKGSPGVYLDSASPSLKRPMTDLNPTSIRWPLASIDFEASCLGEGTYLNEVGLAVWQGHDTTIRTSSTLIAQTRDRVPRG